MSQIMKQIITDAFYVQMLFSQFPDKYRKYYKSLPELIMYFIERELNIVLYFFYRMRKQ